MGHCWRGNGRWHRWGYGYGPPLFVRDYGPEYGYGLLRCRRWAMVEESPAGYLRDLDDEIRLVHEELDRLRGSRGGEGG